MGEFERKALQKYADKPHLWPRYIDDIFMVWSHGEEKLDEFTKYLNDIHPTIKFTNNNNKQVYFHINFDLQLTKLVPAISEGYSKRAQEKRVKIQQLSLSLS